MKTVYYWLATVLILGQSLKPLSYAETIPGQQLLNFFKTNCPGHGNWTRSALQDAEALILTLRTLQNDPDCKSISGAIAQLNLISHKVQSLERLNATELEIAKLEAQQQEILVLMQQTQNTSVLDELQRALREIQIELASLQGFQQQSRSLYAHSQADLLTQTVLSTDTLFRQIVSNQSCLQKQPQLLTSVASLTGAVASAVSGLNPVLGLGLAAGTEFLGNLMEQIRVGSLGRDIRDIAKGTVAQEAFRCTMASMAERWCQIHDVENFLQFRADYHRRQINDTDLITAVNFYDREIPVFLNWLESIRAGVDATTLSDAARQRRVIEREAQVRWAASVGKGVFAENRPLYESASNRENKWAIIKTSILTIIGMMGDDHSNTHPIFEIISSSIAPYFLMGLDNPPRNAQGDVINFYSSFDPFTQWPDGEYVPNYQIILTRFELWIERARERVNQEMTQVLQPDPLAIISNAFDKTSGRWRISPKESLERIIYFLDKFTPSQFDRSAFQLIYLDLIANLEKINGTIEEVLLFGKHPDPQAALQSIYNLARLQFGVIVLQGRLNMIVRLAIAEYFLRAPKDHQVIAAQFLASERFFKVLQEISTTDNYEEIRADLLSAKAMTSKNLKYFGSAFGESIKDILKELVHQEEEMSEDSQLAGPLRYTRTQLCFGLLTLPKWPTDIPPQYCYGLQFTPILLGAPKSIKIDQTAIKANFSKRACYYRNYLRQSKIFQDWGITLNEGLIFNL